VSLRLARAVASRSRPKRSGPTLDMDEARRTERPSAITGRGEERSCQALGGEAASSAGHEQRARSACSPVWQSGQATREAGMGRCRGKVARSVVIPRELRYGR
jgi:hypothetical protein